MTDAAIYKWGPIEFTQTPIRGRIVHCALKDGQVFVWTENFLVPNMKHSERFVRLHPTGEPFRGFYHGSVVMPSGLVWHVIEDHSPATSGWTLVEGGEER